MTMIRKEWTVEDLKDNLGKNLDLWHFLDISSQEFDHLQFEHDAFIQSFRNSNGYVTTQRKMFSQEVLNLDYIEFLVKTFRIKSLPELESFFLEDASWKQFIRKNETSSIEKLKLVQRKSIKYYRELHQIQAWIFFFFLIPFVLVCKRILQHILS